MKRYDLHIHTRYSRCSNLNPETVLKTAKERGLNGIAVTDHNTTKGALEAARLNEDKRFEVIIGEEIRTDKGEVLGYYLKHEIKPGNFYDVVREIKRQGGLAVIAHPYSTVGISRKRADIDDVVGEIDAIEAFNARSFFAFENIQSQIKARELNLAQTAGSDAHFRFEIGRAYVEFEGDLRAALKKKETNVYGSILLAMPARFLTSIQKYVLYPISRLF